MSCGGLDCDVYVRERGSTVTLPARSLGAGVVVEGPALGHLALSLGGGIGGPRGRRPLAARHRGPRRRPAPLHAAPGRVPAPAAAAGWRRRARRACVRARARVADLPTDWPSTESWPCRYAQQRQRCHSCFGLSAPSWPCRIGLSGHGMPRRRQLWHSSARRGSHSWASPGVGGVAPMRPPGDRRNCGEKLRQVGYFLPFPVDGSAD